MVPSISRRLVKCPLTTTHRHPILSGLACSKWPGVHTGICIRVVASGLVYTLAFVYAL